jgi:hypothetical protein
LFCLNLYGTNSTPVELKLIFHCERNNAAGSTDRMGRQITSLTLGFRERR